MVEIYIAAAKRTPIGKLGGALGEMSAADLGAAVIDSIMSELDLGPDAVDEVIMGQVLTGGAGQNPARQAALQAGLPNTIPAMTVNQVCGAGQRSIHLAAQAIKCGDADLIVAGGQDSMTRAPQVVYNTRNGQKAAPHMADSMIVDGLWDVFNDIHMGETVEQLATRFQITREDQDTFAVHSQAKTAKAVEEGRFESQIVPIRLKGAKDERIVSADEHPRPGATAQKLAALKPVFSETGTITAGNSSGLNDGAAAVLVGSEEKLSELGLEPLVRVVSYASAALDPMDMGLGPVHAINAAIRKAGWSADGVDVFEINEAFAAQAIAVNKSLGVDPAKVNVNGGAIALGHPLAGSGGRTVVALIHEMLRQNAYRGVASLCIGGGQGVAICLERP
ncbi:acetyl-CoA C-acetyltransferase [Hoeflea prorocentri]|uniref:Beta-ketothiolase n=1 Tax=Hoeflea prorocentri TaxID=1922333 RepID=A0A9X3UMT2_9HYPH|nr:acetyl-CoA C-acetyltransferase [Hoeflea prorocentri]MCY6383270.1 acetyl-CoA C-acetyltransferase [Hoeflea prorocentri]MDA5401070.1 acetyl-CoA C-acetyltransferase [Hoeflea prorocentri]